jgi:diaminohydroxyphosphoribosylaminopyrimidine deaminase/5-amino-6-(5-phosphoribosylamino)uracil reductase
MRAGADAILIGRGTLVADDPELTCRLPGLEARSPLRVVLSRLAEIPDGAAILRNLERAPLWVLHGPGAPDENLDALAQKGVICLPVETGADGRLDIAAVLTTLAGRGISRLLVEGGPAVAASFLAADLADEVALFHGQRRLKGPAIAPQGLDRVTADTTFTLSEERAIGADRLTLYRRSEFWQD